MSNSFCCIMHSEAQCRKASRFIEWYGAFSFGRLTDTLYNVPWAAPLWSICLQLAESMVGLFYRDELLPPFIVTWDDFLPVENTQNMTFNLVNNLFKIQFFCTSMNRVCNIEGESSRQVAWIYWLPLPRSASKCWHHRLMKTHRSPWTIVITSSSEVSIIFWDRLMHFPKPVAAGDRGRGRCEKFSCHCTCRMLQNGA